MVVFKVGDSHRSSRGSEVGASKLKVEMEPTFAVVEILGDDPLTRAQGQEAVGSSFGSEDLRGGGEELPEKSQDRETEDVVKSAFVLEANVKLAPRGAPANKLLVSVLPSRVGGLRAKNKTQVIGEKERTTLFKSMSGPWRTSAQKFSSSHCQRGIRTVLGMLRERPDMSR